MDGKRLRRQLRHMLNEESGSNYLDSFTSYDLLNQAAMRLNERITHLVDSEDLTTVADQSFYDLRPDFMRLVDADHLGRDAIRWNDGSAFHRIPRNDFEHEWHNREYSETSIAVPDSFSITPEDSPEDLETGNSTTSAGAAVAGKCNLIDSTATFSTTDSIFPGDTVHNTTDGSMGVIISITSDTTLTTALFDGTDNDWSSSDNYIIQPQARYKLRLNPPTSASGDTITYRYLRRPQPVYSDYDHFNFPLQFQDALVYYAVGLYKMRSQMIGEAATWFQQAEALVKVHQKSQMKALDKQRVIVNFKKKQRNY